MVEVNRKMIHVTKRTVGKTTQCVGYTKNTPLCPVKGKIPKGSTAVQIKVTSYPSNTNSLCTTCATRVMNAISGMNLSSGSNVTIQETPPDESNIFTMD